MTKTMLFGAVLAAGLGLSGCNKAPEAPATDTATTEPVAVAAADGGAMQATKTIVENASAAPELKTLVSTLQAAGLAETLSGAGPFTVFAPTDAAFAQVPPVTRDGWMRPAQKAVLAGILNYHVVPGKLSAADLDAQIKAGGGKAVLKTVGGQDLTATVSGSAILLTSASGNKATVTKADLGQSNGMIHEIDAVLLPKM